MLPSAACSIRPLRTSPSSNGTRQNCSTRYEGSDEGAEIGFERALFLQVASELEPKPEGGCSSFGTSLVGLGPIVAQNWDTTEDYAGKAVVLRLRPRGKPALMMFTIAGVIGYIGQNEHGVGQVANSLYSDSRRTGLSGYFIMRKFLEARSVDEAVSWLRGVKIGSNGNYLLGDAVRQCSRRRARWGYLPGDVSPGAGPHEPLPRDRLEGQG